MVEIIHKEQDIDKVTIFQLLEESISSSLKNYLSLKDNPLVKIDQTTGLIHAYKRENGQEKEIDTKDMGRIAYQSARQTFLAKLREAKSDHVFSEFAHKKDDIVNCRVIRHERGDIICEIAKDVEAILPRREQVQGENYNIGSKFKALVIGVDKKTGRVNIIISRAHENFVKKLFFLEVPEIQSNLVEIVRIERDPGYRTKITVRSNQDKLDCLGACVGTRGARIKNVVDELNGENIDIIKWSDNPEELVKNALKPAEVLEVTVNENEKRAVVYVTKEELSQAIGKGGRNVKLASTLTDWEIDIYPVGEQGPEEQTENEAK
jgi:N utilization substance protein A